MKIATMKRKYIRMWSSARRKYQRQPAKQLRTDIQTQTLWNDEYKCAAAKRYVWYIQLFTSSVNDH